MYTYLYISVVNRNFTSSAVKFKFSRYACHRDDLRTSVHFYDLRTRFLQVTYLIL